MAESDLEDYKRRTADELDEMLEHFENVKRARLKLRTASQDWTVADLCFALMCLAFRAKDGIV